MQNSTFNLDTSAFKTTMEEAPTKENGWELDYDGPARKDFADSKIKIYKRVKSGETVITVRLEGVMKGFKAENIYKMFSDIALRPKWDSTPKVIKLVEQISPNNDIIYQELNLPFPLTNRDFVQKRLYLDNKSNSEIIKQLGLYEREHRYFVILLESTERPEYPRKDSPVRGETKMAYYLIEEDPENSNNSKITVVMCQDLKGSIPFMVINKVATKIPHKLVGSILDNYGKLFPKL